MKQSFNLNTFISEQVIKRKTSLFKQDIEENRTELTREIENKTILVIGGAGSIGSSFIKAILPFKPKSLVVVDINENGLAELTRDIRSTENLYVPDEYVPYPINFSDPVFEKMFRSHRGFDIVANFSAHKHVRSEKDIFSVEALLQNNVIRAQQFLNLLSEFPPKHFFCVSTDKAANPVNIMGASKKIMEDMIFSYSEFFPVKTARFANVAFSNGSLPAGFLERIAKRQPISAPSDVTRYFVSPKESGEICMLACILGENREIFFPKLEKESMMTFSEIAERLLTSLGYSIKKCTSENEALSCTKELENGSHEYPVYFTTSDTTGEKAFEEFFTQNETISLNRFRSLGIVQNIPVRDKKEIETLFSHLKTAFNSQNCTKNDIVKIVKNFLPNFEHEEKNKSLDAKM